MQLYFSFLLFFLVVVVLVIVNLRLMLIITLLIEILLVGKWESGKVGKWESGKMEKQEVKEYQYVHLCIVPQVVMHKSSILFHFAPTITTSALSPSAPPPLESINTHRYCLMVS